MKSNGSMNETKREVGMKAKAELTAESLKAVIIEKKPSSLTRLAHEFGYTGSVSGSLAKKFRLLVPNIDELLKGTANSEGQPEGDSKGKAKVVKALKVVKVAKATAKKPDKKPAKGATMGHVKAGGAKTGKYARDPRNPFREGSSSYGKCFDILAFFPAGLPREELIRLLAAETKKDIKRAGYDAQVVLSAHPNDNGLSNNDSPRHRSCRAGFWIKRTNGHVQLMLVD
jgi:hypothetical protein